MSANEGNLAYDTERQYIGTVYAKGLLGATTAPGLSETVVSELEELVGSVLPKLPKLVSLLESPRVPLNVKEQVIDPIQQFMKGAQKAIYDEAQQFVQAQKPNFAYLADDDPAPPCEVPADARPPAEPA